MITTQSNSQLGVGDRLWSKLWNLECPLKMCHFLWRACKGSLATNQERIRRHIAPSPLCDRCQDEVELTCHALVDCNLNKPVWDDHPGGLILSRAPRTSFSDLYGWLVENASKTILVLIATAM